MKKGIYSFFWKNQVPKKQYNEKEKEKEKEKERERERKHIY